MTEEKKLRKELEDIKRDIDKEDMEYLLKVAMKQCNQHDGRTPKYQLADEDFERWEGVNVQSIGRNPPTEEEDTLALYLINVTKGEVKRFTVSRSLLQLLGRGTNKIAFGTTIRAGTHKSKVVIQWEKEVRE